jgi:hypothetical protein
MTLCCDHVRELVRLALSEVSRLLYSQKCGKWMNKPPQEVSSEAQTKCNNCSRVILSFQQFIVKYKAKSPKTSGGSIVFYGWPGVEYDKKNGR